MELKALFFDLDGTLADVESSIEIAFDETFAVVTRYHPDLKKETFREHFDETLRMVVEAELRGVPQYVSRQERYRETLKRLGYPDPVLADRLAEVYSLCRTTSLTLYPDVAPLLTWLHTRYTLGIVTNGPAGTQRGEVQALEIEGYFKHILVSEEVGYAKPHPSIFQRALELAEVPPGEALFVGDTPETDILGAQGVGLKTVWLNRKGRRWPEGLSPPEHSITTLAQLPDLL